MAERIIGSVEDISVLCGYHRKSAYLWRNPSEWRDAGDFPSARIMRRLLDYAAEKGLPLTADHLIRGASAEEIEALLAPDGMAAE
ncbi:hypothetical protein BV509_00910 [Rhodovulum sulfidophilum]|nr:hypothetical protein BV509_00910 [Rhodovulum sulfidophilum]